MSTDMQNLSMEFQRSAIFDFAKERGLEIVASYADEGRSGLTLRNRPAMQRLLQDVAQKPRPFSSVLVYDVSRWGRFQDTDASAYYEYHCRLNGVDVIYVQESFGTDCSPMTTLIKSIKRAMAAEYSRELGKKVKAGQTTAIQRGFQMGTLPFVGLRRVAVSPDGTTRPLGLRDRKGRPTDHIRWVWGPDNEVALVRRIFREYADTDITIRGLAQELRSEGITAADGTQVTVPKVQFLLDSEAFIGNFVWGRFNKVGGREPRRRDSTDSRIARASGVVPPLIDRATWDRVHKKKRLYRTGRPVYSRDELLARLRAALKVAPNLAPCELAAYGCPAYRAYQKMFGSFPEAAKLAGRDPRAWRNDLQTQLGRSRRLSNRIALDVCSLMQQTNVACRRIANQRIVEIQGLATIRIQVVLEKRRYDVPVWRLIKNVNSAVDRVMLFRVGEDGTASDIVYARWDAYLRLPKWLPSELPAGVVRLRNASEVQDALMQLVSASPSMLPLEHTEADDQSA